MSPDKINKDVLREAVSFSVETHSGLANARNIARVVLVNEQGERILDTLILPQIEDVALKAGLKNQLFKLSKEKGAPIEVVREYVSNIIKGKALIGYHLPQKMSDFGLLNTEKE